MTNQENRDNKRLDQLTQGLVVSITLALVLGICFFLYQYDNQYTKSCPQPNAGILDLRSAPLDDKSQPYHLQRDWEFYPGVTLTPEDDFSMYSHSLCSLSTDIRGQKAGKGTYRLRVLLPNTPMSYVLKLPTTFSTYQLYINHDLILSMGPMGVENCSKNLFQHQSIAFWASGEVQILIHYSNEKGLYHGMGGLSAPPILGRPFTIYTNSEYHQSFLVVSMALILLILLLSISVFLRSWQMTNLAMIVLCISAAAYLAYPLASTEMFFPVYPWYQIEMLFYFACHAATHWVYSLYFGWRDRMAKFINWYSVAAVVLCLIMLLPSLYLPKAPGGEMFYNVIRLLQWGSILCGIALTLRMVISAVPNRLIAAASVSLWAFMLIDMVISDFSPVVFARLPEMGMICFMAISVMVEFVDVASAHRFRVLYAQKIAHAEQLLKLEERHYAQLYDQVEDARRVRHDLRQHLRVIRNLLDRGNSDDIITYLEQYTEYVQPLLKTPLTFFQIPVVDALVAHYWAAAQACGAEFKVEGQLQMLPQSVHVDFCSIMGNLLENAMEALERQGPHQARWIHVRCEIVQKKLMLEVENSNSAPVREENSRFQSSKRDELGTGTLSVSLIAKQYGGLAHFSHEKDRFTAQVLLPLSNIEDREEKRAIAK